MEKRIEPQYWLPSSGIVLEKNAEEAIKTDLNVLVSAGPGAGKTELLAQKAGYLFQTGICPAPQKILAISFKKDAAENLRIRVSERFGSEFGSRFLSVTYDAFAKILLDHFLYALPEKLQPKADYLVNKQQIINAAFAKVGDNRPSYMALSAYQRQYASEILNASFPLGNDSVSKVWELLLVGFDHHNACLSFQMINKLAEYIIRTNIRIKKALQVTYSHVFLDEFQDTTDLQYNLVKTCFKNAKTFMTAVGDAKQRIMVWAGARKTIFADYQSDFSAKYIPLLINHRSAPRLVNLQKQMYESLREKSIAVTSSSNWGKDDGEIRLYTTNDEENEANYVVDDIAKKIAAGIKPIDICILCKQRPQDYTNLIISKLRKQGIKVRIEVAYQDLLKEPIVQILIDFILLSLQRKRSAEWESVCKATEFILRDSSEKEKYYKRQESLVSKLDEICISMHKCQSLDSFHAIVISILDYWGDDNIRVVFPAYSQGSFFYEVVTHFVELLWEEKKRYRGDWIRAVEDFQGKETIPIMTIHKSKGLEYSAIYFIGLEDNAFWNFKNQPEEDRCAFFVALSRAKEFVAFTFCKRRVRNNQIQLQSIKTINEFYALLRSPGMAEIIGSD